MVNMYPLTGMNDESLKLYLQSPPAGNGEGYKVGWEEGDKGSLCGCSSVYVTCRRVVFVQVVVWKCCAGIRCYGMTVLECCTFRVVCTSEEREGGTGVSAHFIDL